MTAGMAPVSNDGSEDHCDFAQCPEWTNGHLRPNLSDAALHPAEAGEQLSTSAGSSPATVETIATVPASPREALKRCFAAAGGAEAPGRPVPASSSGFTPRRSSEGSSTSAGAGSASVPASPSRMSRSSSSGGIARGKLLQPAQEHSSQARIRMHSNGSNRPYYMPTLNSNPIPLRGRRRNSDAPTQEASAAIPVATPATPNGVPKAVAWTEAASAEKPEKPPVWLPCANPLMTRDPASAAERRPSALTVCSIATPRQATAPSTPTSLVASDRGFDACREKSGNATVNLGEFQRQLQETRDRLASVEAEQRRLISTSLGALLVKAASPGKLPSSSAFMENSPGSDAAELPADTMMVPGADHTPPRMAVDLTTITSPAGTASSNSRVHDTSRLEDENRLLREAIARANMKNSELAARREAAEARGKLLEEENRRAQEALHGGKRSPSQIITSQLGTPTLSASQSPAARGTNPKAAAEAHQNLLDTSLEVERRLGDLLARRSHLQAKFQSTPGLSTPTSAH